MKGNIGTWDILEGSREKNLPDSRYLSKGRKLWRGVVQGNEEYYVRETVVC